MAGLGSEVTKLALMSLPLWAGVLMNIYNLLLTLVQLWQSRKSLAVNAVICCISCSNVLLSLSCLLLMLLITLNATVAGSGQVNPLFCVALYLWLSSCSVSFWSIAWLNVFYCVKVVSFSMECLRRLKRNISSLTCAALVLTLVGSCLLLSPFLGLQLVISQVSATYGTNANHGTNGTDGTYATHGTNGSMVQNVSYSFAMDFAPWIDTTLYTATFICLLGPLPLMVMVPTALRLVAHLCQHTLSLRRNQTQSQALESYLQVCKLTVSLVGVYLTTLFIVSFFFISQLQQSLVGYDLVMLGCTFYSVSTAALLTASSRHLKDRLCCAGRIQQT